MDLSCCLLDIDLLQPRHPVLGRLLPYLIRIAKQAFSHLVLCGAAARLAAAGPILGRANIVRREKVAAFAHPYFF